MSEISKRKESYPHSYIRGGGNLKVKLNIET